MTRNILIFSVLVVFGLPLMVNGQDPKMTEDWSKEPPIITPGKRMKAPSDAIVLFFRGKDISNWTNRAGEPAEWSTSCRKMKGGRKGDIITAREFGDCQLHVEWRTPCKVEGEGQGRGNSGIYLQTLYEVQILDSYENITYYNGQAGSIYKQSPPLVNASRKPGRWQYYDIIFRAPRFTDDGSLESPAILTVFHNGVLVQDHFELIGPTTYAGYPRYEAHEEKRPLLLQDHGNPVRYRNIWIREL